MNTHDQKKNNQETDIHERHEPNAGHVLSPIWLRLFVQDYNERYRFFLGSRYYFLLYLRVIFSVLYFIIEAFK
jgi:hypothetical protein